MTDNEFDTELDLLIPEDIPIESPVDIKTAKKLSRVLSLFLTAIQKTEVTDGLVLINCALSDLDDIETTLAKITKTKTSLKKTEVQDYDRYFKINRIQSEQPEIALVKGLIVNTQIFLLLCQKCGDRLDLQQIDRQKQGFKTYALLLARNFQLNISDKIDL